jgi:hypothetical protein
MRQGGSASLRCTINDVNDRAQRLTFRFSKKLSEYGAF